MTKEDDQQQDKNSGELLENDSADANAIDSTPVVTQVVAADDALDGADQAAAQATKSGGNGIAWLALLLALLAAAAAGYSAWTLLQQTEQLQTLSSTSDSHHQQSQNMQQAIQASDAKTAKALTQRDQKITRLSSALQEANAVVEGHSRRLLSLTATTTDDWRLAEVEYLLRLANQRILTSKDGETALNLLRAADQIILELGDPRLFKVRESIADDRASLSLVGQQDLDGIFLQLSSLSKLIDRLPLLVVPEFDSSKSIADSEVTESTAPAWQQKFIAIGKSTWREVKSLLIIQGRDTDIKPLLPPEQQYYLRGNLRLLINQAQLALLDGRQVAYLDSLESAEQWLKDYFPNDEAATQTVIADIQQLQMIKVEVELPDVSNSLLAIKGFIADQHRISKGDIKPKEKKSAPASQPASESKSNAKDDSKADSKTNGQPKSSSEKTTTSSQANISEALI